MEELLATIVDWLARHPSLAAASVFLISLSESLVVVGLFVPGTLVMFAIGALVALGALDLWATIAWAAGGAIVGDGVSYWIGRHYRGDIRNWWPFSRHPEWLARAEAFFRRHGGKSVVFGRFAGPVRPIIPAVAGMLGMPPGRFYRANILSAVTWAPAYILPGVVLGASLAVAAKVATRLIVLIGLSIALLWLTYVLVRGAYLFLAPRLDRALIRLLVWGKAHPLLRGVANGVLDPDHPDLKALLELTAMLVVGFWLFAALVSLQIGHPAPFPVDFQLNYLFQHLRSPWADELMVSLGLALDAPVNAAVLAAGVAWLGWTRRWDAAGHWLGAVGVAALAAWTLNLALPVPPPRPELQATVAKYAFPSAHITVLSALYGFLAVLLAQALPHRRRRLPYTAAGLLLVSACIVHLYLARSWASGVLGGVVLGLAWTSLVGIAYRRHADRLIGWRGLIACIGAALLIGLNGHVAIEREVSLASLAPMREAQSLARANWWERDWAKLPARRVDWEGEPGEPFNLQWAGDGAALANHLEARGWQKPPPLNTAGMLAWLKASPVMAELPALPQVHDGRHETLIRVLPLPADPSAGQPEGRLVLRLWPADWVLTPDQTPVSVGNISRQQVHGAIGLLQIPRGTPPGDAEIDLLEPYLAGLDWRRVRREGVATGDWSGEVLLLRRPLAQEGPAPEQRAETLTTARTPDQPIRSPRHEPTVAHQGH